MSVIDGDILVVIDNCDELINREKKEFKWLISMMLQRVQHMKILLTARQKLSSTPEFAEDLINLDRLSNDS